ncbi:bifunctional helix-turn-helix transcriptional regulator/GNAT family N-acetyltransferase [Parapedobacter sp. ISTM3]|uniref:bifunctional helix-turn-helix transcriptional regulator/GNAT family N-acetyltransferase n=1 Tax=Parapedobacter sp. ISTM3 TaxID=2800130 RepID=UPI00190817C4|nr:bifunctional helix-turn-helix transcriptional regulator/GNAT family N-acetyltransferase [Parapedobacter sp. ISTM3]MBK1439419.1 bifunctional helix-turn-helix transcriptional regulator/GNAT family N-acetyltransferase [Parapedobacter sp. ISTM3]
MDGKISQIRLFNRFYTAQLGILSNRFLDSPYSLSEVRVLYEIGEHGCITAHRLSELLQLDKGYLSRILKLYRRDGIIEKKPSDADRRAYDIRLTDRGKAQLAELQRKQDEQIRRFIGSLRSAECDRLISAMQTIKRLVSMASDNKALGDRVTYRAELYPGDIGYLIHLHGKLYAEESGYSQAFECYVVKTFYEFLERYKPDKDKVWLALYDGEIVGCIAIVDRPGNEAQLRWFLVHPGFRGAGIGRNLLEMALAHCRERRYTCVYLLTTDIQQRAIAMYKCMGFRPTAAVEVVQWGKVLREERYDLLLDSSEER